MDGLNKFSSYNIYNIFQVFWYTLNTIYLLISNICMEKNVEQWNNIFQCWILIVFQNVHKCIIKIFMPIKTRIWFWELNLGGCCMVDFKRDGNSFTFMITLESFIWKTCKALSTPLKYLIDSKMLKVRIDWKFIPHQHIMHLKNLFQM